MEIKVKQQGLKIKDLNLTYARKIILFTMLFWLMLFIPSILKGFSADSYQGPAFAILWYSLISFGIYITCYVSETRSISNLSLEIVFVYLFFSLFIGLASMASYYVLFLTFGYPQAIPLWLMYILNLAISLAISWAFAWTIKNLYLISVQVYPNAKARETSVRMFFMTFPRLWTTYAFSNNTILITRRGIYVIKLFHSNEKIREITFKHQIKNPAISANSDILATEINSDLNEYVFIDDDQNVKNMNTVVQDLSKKFELEVTPIFLIESDDLPTIYSKPSNYLICKYENLFEEIKSIDDKSNLHISKHDKIVRELRK